MNLTEYRPSRRSFGLGLLALLVPALQGCKTPPPRREPLVLDDTFNPAAVETIAILPVADLRVDRKPGDDLTRVVQKAATRTLKDRGYASTAAPADAAPGNLTEADFRKPDPNWVRSLPPQNARWVLLVAVRDAVSQTGAVLIIATRTATVELSAFLYDRESGRCVWHDRGAGQAFTSGAFDVLLDFGEQLRQTVGAATADALTGLPVRAKR